MEIIALAYIIAWNNQFYNRVSLCYTMSVGKGERSFADGDPENSFAGRALPERAAGIPGIRGDRPR